MKSVAIFLMAAALMLAGCGSSGGGGFLPTGNGVLVTCGEVAAAQDGNCESQQVDSKPTDGLSAMASIGNITTTFFNSGIVNTDDIIYTEMEATNYGFKNARIFIVVADGVIPGCDFNGHSWTYVFEVASLSTAGYGTSGTGYDVCAIPGEGTVITTIYNASELPIGSVVKNIEDFPNYEVLSNAVTRFTFK